MDAADVPGPTLAEIAARYYTKVTATAPAPGGITLLLAANPDRWYVEFWDRVGGGNFPAPMPGPIPDGITNCPTTTPPTVYKFRDCPAIVTGEFYQDGLAMNGYWIIEQIQRG